MPFPVYTVAPVRLSALPVPQEMDNKLECVTNSTLCQAIRQLASILSQADQIFQELGSQCQQITDRTVRVQARVATLKVDVDNFNPRKQKIPAGDLETFSKMKTHYKTDYQLDTELFTKDSRTEPLKRLYEEARDKHQPKVQRDQSSLLFLPYFSDTDRPQYEIETSLPSNYEQFTSELHHRGREWSERLPVQAEVVTVDVSGKTFSRMTDYRRSLLPSVTTRRKRRKNRDRRNTVAGGEKLSAAIAENTNRSRSQEGRKREEGEGSRSKAEVEDWTSLDVTAGSSLYISPVGTVDMSGDTSYEDRTLSDIHCPPPLPILDKTGSELQKLRSLGEMALSPRFSDKDRESDHYYETLNSVNMRSISTGKRVANSHPDGALSSSGVWTGSVSGVSETSERDVNPVTLTTKAEVQVRPKSSLSLGVVSDNESLLGLSKAREEDSESQTLMEENIPFMDEPDESVHSCDTEGYYTTFHDFDGFQEVANEYNFMANESGDCPEESSGPCVEVVYRKKPGRDGEEKPSPPQRLSSLVRDNRESLDTVVLASDLSHQHQAEGNYEEPTESVSESDAEVTKHLALTSRYIPSLCVVTPPLSEKTETMSSGRTSLNVSQCTTESTESACVGLTLTAVAALDKINVPTETELVVSDLHRLSVTSTSSDLTSHSGKLVSITPDIVKPSKEIADTPEEEMKVKEKEDPISEEKQELVGEKILPSGSGSHLPDMLSHTPEVSQSSESHDKVQDDLEPSTLSQHPQQQPQQLSKHAELHRNLQKTSWAESPTESPNMVPITGMAAVMRPGVSCDLPKLRITSPFAPYKDTTRHNIQHKERLKHNSSCPPSALSHHQGEIERRQESESSHPKISDSLRGDTVAAQHSKQSTPLSGPSSYGTDAQRYCEEKSNLKRSDSYRNARTILSPDLSKINRKSPDISPANKIENASYVSFNKITTVGVDSMVNTSGEGESLRDDKEKHSGSRNFFKNIRNQFSTLSLRRKPSKKNVTEKNNVTPDSKSEMKRRNSFNSFLKSSSNKSPDKPRLTSTPINSESSPNGKPKVSNSKAQQNLNSEWTKSAPSFRTAAVRHQQQQQQQYHQQHQYHLHNHQHPLQYQHHLQQQGRDRWSYAEQLYSQPESTYGYIQSHNGHHSQLHLQPHHHVHQHQLQHHQPNQPRYPDHLYGTYGHQPIYQQSSAGSQRSSVSSLYGLYSTNSMRRTGSLNRGSSSHSVISDTRRSPPHSVTSDTRRSPPHSVTSDTGSGKTCECPMCYHSVSNPCRDCGCPSRSSASSSLSLNRQGRAGDFISPSSDYHSLSPASPIQSDPAWSQPLYAKIVKQKPPSDSKKTDDSITKDNHLPAPPKHQSSKPSAPSSISRQERADNRRHSWAGDKKGPVQKQTSLQDFKKLLAQQSPSQNPHRISAKELLEKSASSQAENVYTSSHNKLGGSARKRSSPWVDKRFSVIQEEIEGSKENLIE